MDKNDYMQLKQRYFDALTTPAETEALEDYVFRTDDPDFDDLRAVLSYLAVGRQVHGNHSQPRTGLRPVAIFAAAICIGAVIVAGSLLLRGPRVTAQPSREDLLASMESTLTSIFSHEATNIENQLSEFFTP